MTAPTRATQAALALAAAAAALTAAFVLGIVAVTFLDTRVFHDPLEAAALFSVQAWREGGLAAVYPADWNTAPLPLILTPYPPLFHGLWALLATVTGAGADYAPGRILALVALLGCVALLYGCARTLQVPRLAAAAFALIFLTPMPTAMWAGVARVDLPGIALALLGLWLYLRIHDGPGYRMLWSAIPFALAGLTKQSLVAAPAAVVLSELAARRPYRAGAFAVVTAGGVLLTFVVLNAVTAGGFFNATLHSLADEIFLLTGIALAADFLVSGPVLIVLTALVLGAPLALRRVEHPTPLLYLLLAVGMLALTVGKPGANLNYYLEPLAALSLAAAVGFEQLRRARPRVAFAGAACLAAALLWSAAQSIPEYRSVSRLKRGMIAAAQGGIELPAGVLDGRPVAAPPWTYPLLKEPRPVYYMNDDYTFGAMAAWGKLFDGQRFVEDLRAQRLAAVIATRQVLSADEAAFVGDWWRGWHFWSAPGFREALFDAYERTEVTLPLGLLLYVPAPRAAEPGSP